MRVFGTIPAHAALAFLRLLVVYPRACTKRVCTAARSSRSCLTRTIDFASIRSCIASRSKALPTRSDGR